MIIIISNKTIDFNKEDILVINSNVQLISDYELKYNDNLIQFDYLIIDDLSKISNIENGKMLLDDGIPVTNWYGETSVESIFYGDINKALNFLFEGE